MRRAVVLEMEITLKATMMIGQDMDLILPPIANQLATLLQTLPNHPGSKNETGPSGTGTTATGGSNLPPFSTISPCLLCCFYLLWLPLPPCGDSWALQPGQRVFFCRSCTFWRRKVNPFGCTSRSMKRAKKGKLSNNGKTVYSTNWLNCCNRAISLP